MAPRFCSKLSVQEKDSLSLQYNTEGRRQEIIFMMTPSKLISKKALTFNTRISTLLEKPAYNQQYSVHAPSHEYQL